MKSSATDLLSVADVRADRLAGREVHRTHEVRVIRDLRGMIAVATTAMQMQTDGRTTDMIEGRVQEMMTTTGVIARKVTGTPETLEPRVSRCPIFTTTCQKGRSGISLNE